MIVVKRDGRKENFNISKVEAAVKAAFISVGDISKERVEKISQDVVSMVASQEVIHVEQIHTLVEDCLMSTESTRPVARSYIEYRHDRDKEREGRGKLYSDVVGFLDRTEEEFTRENANKPSHLVNTHRDLLAGILSKHVALTQILPKQIADWHVSGFGHIHDLDYLISPLTNCALINYRDMLENGFRIGNARIEKPKGIGVAATVLSQVIQSVSSVQYGGQTSAHIDEGLSQYVEMTFHKNHSLMGELGVDGAKEKALEMTDKDVYDAMQTLLYQINSLMGTNGCKFKK